MITDNQVLKHFLTKPRLRRHEARWLHLFGHFEISKISLGSGKVHVLGDVLSRAPLGPELYDAFNMEIVNFELPDRFIEIYASDPIFGSIIRVIQGIFPVERHRIQRTKNLLLHLKLQENKLFIMENCGYPEKKSRTFSN